jgi:hypothetical protein
MWSGGLIAPRQLKIWRYSFREVDFIRGQLRQETATAKEQAVKWHMLARFFCSRQSVPQRV